MTLMLSEKEVMSSDRTTYCVRPGRTMMFKSDAIIASCSVPPGQKTSLRCTKTIPHSQ